MNISEQTPKLFDASYLLALHLAEEGMPHWCFCSCDQSLHLALQGEWWFQTSRSGSEDAESSSSQPSQVLEERLSTLNQTAAAMARADVWKKDQARRNRHPDYEFFLSRQQR
uniref:Uncharacterized protein n=1 Tax=Aegilops tauschii subsp. strangulata TaxID=200361 RepID=A0A453TDC2_AEGTS